MDLVGKVKKTIIKENLIKDGNNVLVGLSGGIDSTALLYVLAELARENHYKIGIAHLNHLLRGDESDRDQLFVEELAGQFSFPCHVKRLDVGGYAKSKGMSLQHAGRDVRYDFFNEIAIGYDYDRIAIAHNLDDQVETFVLRMLKGTGVKGLTSIPIKRDRIIRPFLNIYRDEIVGYVVSHSIMYVEDSSNDKTKYERNYVRREIMPMMKKINPVFKEKIYLLLQDITRINSFFEKRASAFADNHSYLQQNGDISLEVKKLAELDEETRFRVTAKALALLKPGFIVLREHYRLIEKIMTGRRPNLAVMLPYGIRAMRIYDRMIFTRKKTKQAVDNVFPVVEGKNMFEPLSIVLEVTRQPVESRFDDVLWKSIEEAGEDIAFFDADKTGDMFLRTFREGDRFIPLGMGGHVKLKDFYISRKVPREQRWHVPLLLSNDDIMWVIGHRIDERFKVTGQTREVLKVVASPY